MRVKLITKQDSLANIAWNILGIFQGAVTLYKPHKEYILLDENNFFYSIF